MADEMKHGILLISDISGYTEYVRRHAPSASHARLITVRLLKAIVSASRPPLEVAELEGDAVFFYALGSEAELPALAERVKDQIPHLFRAFAQEIDVLGSTTFCRCHACSGIGALRLKHVVHTGEVAVETIGPFEKLFGLAVIVVHRMLKSGVPAREYVMLSEPAFSSVDGFFGLAPERRVVELDGIGRQTMMVYYGDQFAAVLAAFIRDDRPRPDPSMTQIVRWNLGLRLRTFVDLFRGKPKPPAVVEPPAMTVGRDDP